MIIILLPTKPNNGKDGGTALKPALEPITVARKPFEGTVASNVLKHGTGGINIDECRVESNGVRPMCGTSAKSDVTSYTLGSRTKTETTNGRFPANLIHDGSDEVLTVFPNSKGQQGVVKGSEKSHTGNENASCYGEYNRVPFEKRNDSGSAARFFYCAKASKKDRNEGLEDKSTHPTVKPTELMKYLCRLVTPLGGIVLDPFMGSGSTGKAAMTEGFKFIGIEISEEYAEIARKRIDFATKTDYYSIDEICK